MPEPKTAEEVLNALDHRITRDGDWDTIEEALKVVQDYARQRVEAWREKACEAVCTLCDEGCPIEYDERGAYHKWQERDQDGDPVDVTDGCDAEALRTLPVEMP